MTVHNEGIEVAPSTSVFFTEDVSIKITPNLSKYYDKLREVQKTVDKCKGVMLIVGGGGDNNDDDNEEEEEKKGHDNDTEDCTEEQILELRHIIITENRVKCIKRMYEAVDKRTNTITKGEDSFQRSCILCVIMATHHLIRMCR